MHKHLMKISKGYGPANEDLLLCSERCDVDVTETQGMKLGKAGAVQSHFGLIYVQLGAFNAFTWPPLGMVHESSSFLLAKTWSP